MTLVGRAGHSVRNTSFVCTDSPRGKKAGSQCWGKEDLRGGGKEAGSARENNNAKFCTSASCLRALEVLPEVCPHSLLLQPSFFLFLFCVSGTGKQPVRPSPPTVLATQTHQTASMTSLLQKDPKKIIESVASFKGLTSVYLC